jgi:hypothetical protein
VVAWSADADRPLELEPESVVLFERQVEARG